MKRLGNIMPLVADMENLRIAFLKACRGKNNRQEIIRFRESLDKNLGSIHNDLLNGTYSFGEYRKFVIHDPKERLICAACFRDRVTFHAMMRICHSVFENYQVHHSYASRLNKGTYKAIEQAQLYAKRYKWFVKLDVCHYFDTIDHCIMLSQLRSLFKDTMLLDYFKKLLDTYHVDKGKGLPIGNLTSQYFANHYLAIADHYILEKIHATAIVRYMDDYVLFSDNLQSLKICVEKIVAFMEDTLHLKMHEPIYNKTHFGVSFLGYIVNMHEVRLNQQSRRRYRIKVSNLQKQLSKNNIDEKYFCIHYESLRAFVEKANTNRFLENIGTFS